MSEKTKLSACKVGDQIAVREKETARLLGFFTNLYGSRLAVLGRTNTNGVYSDIEEIKRSFPAESGTDHSAFAGYQSYHVWFADESVTVVSQETRGTPMKLGECKVGDRVVAQSCDFLKTTSEGTIIGHHGSLIVLARKSNDGPTSVNETWWADATEERCKRYGVKYGEYGKFSLWGPTIECVRKQAPDPATAANAKAEEKTTLKVGDKINNGAYIGVIVAIGRYNHSRGTDDRVVLMVKRDNGGGTRYDDEYSIKNRKDWGIEYAAKDSAEKFDYWWALSSKLVEPAPKEEEMKVDTDADKKTTTLKVGERIENAGRTGTIVGFGKYDTGLDKDNVVAMVRLDAGFTGDTAKSALKYCKDWNIDFEPTDDGPFDFWWAHNSKRIEPEKEIVQPEQDASKTSLVGMLGLLATGVAVGLLTKGMKHKQTSEVIRVNAPDAQNDDIIAAEQEAKENAT